VGSEGRSVRATTPRVADRFKEETSMSVSSLLPSWAVPRRGRGERRAAHRLTLSITVDYPDAVRVRRALMQETAPAIELLECRTIPHTHSARMQIVCDTARAADVMHRVMESADAAEFGPLSSA
jgi:hypothetical protein